MRHTVFIHNIKICRDIAFIEKISVFTRKIIVLPIFRK